MVLITLIVATYFATQNPASDRIDAELARLRSSATDALGGQQSAAIKDAADRSKRALDRAHLYLALEELQNAWVLDAAVQSVARMPATKTLSDFEAEWNRRGEPAAPEVSANLPAAVAAIASTAASRGPSTWRASRPYAEDAGVDAGFYYLGEAHGWSAFARMAASLPLRAPGRMPSVRPMAGAIAQLELETAKQYDKAAADARRNFIPINVALKIARQLASEGKQAAALYQYLAARYRLGIAMGAPPVAPQEVKREIAALRDKLRGDEDHSIAELFLQRADAIVDAGDMGAANAAIIARTVIPEYLQSVQVTVTLVRWPFT